MLRGRRTVVVLAIVAVVSLAAGLGLSRLIISPGAAAAAAAAPTAGSITVPVEEREISNTLVLRGDVGYDDPVSLSLESGDLGGPAVVTGQVPTVGASLDAASVALEVVGRPVILLPGGLPTYRTLRAGVSGPDVQQLRTALAALGIPAGDPANAAYDSTVAAAVRALYQRVGYEPPAVDADVQSTVTAAQQAVTAAQQQVTSAQNALTAAKRGTTTNADRVRLDGDVTVARSALDYANAQCALPADQRDAAVECSAPALARLQADLDSATAARAAVDAVPDTSAEQSALSEANTALAQAKADQTKAQASALTPLPAAEVAFVATLPRRVDSVSVTRGQTVNGEFATVSGATIQVQATADSDDAALLAVGTTGSVTLDGTDLPVTVSEITTAAATSGDSATGDGSTDAGTTVDPTKRTVVFTFAELTADQAMMLQGTNVRVRIPVSSTNGEVLAVPLAALTAGPGGESRVEVSDGKDGSHLVQVQTGLAAGGFVEIVSADEPLAAGDLLVVGVQAGSGTEESDEEATPAATQEATG